LWQRRIVREQGANTYDFTHDKTREVAYAEISLLARACSTAVQALEYSYIGFGRSAGAGRALRRADARRAIPTIGRRWLFSGGRQRKAIPFTEKRLSSSDVAKVRPDHWADLQMALGVWSSAEAVARVVRAGDWAQAFASSWAISRHPA
jgi:hypothetical protein